MTEMNQIDLLAEQIWHRKMGHEAPYILLLGAGASIDSGSYSMQSIISDIAEKQGKLPKDAPESEKLQAFYDIIKNMSNDNRYSILKHYFEGRTPSSGYQYLAKLIKSRYFKLIFTTNFDTFLEDALYDISLRTCDFQTLICGKDMADSISKIAAQPTPQIKIIKLHGDLNARILALLPDEIFQFSQTVETLLTEQLKKDVIIVGHRMLDNDINRTITADGGELWYVNPEKPALDKFIGQAASVRKSYQVHGEKGTFDYFFKTLYQAIETLSNNQKVAMKSPKNDNTDFENRIYDLDFLCDPSKPRFIGIDAPAGYGKTYLLKEFQRRQQKANIFCILIDLAENTAARYDISELLHEIGEQGFNIDIQAAEPEILEQELIKLFLKEKKSKIQILFDSTNLLHSDITKWLREYFIPHLDTNFENHGVELRVVVAGRYLSAEWSNTAYKFHIRQLDPFDDAVIESMIHKFKQQDESGSTLKENYIHELKRAISEISGGHPKAIRSIIEDVGNNMFIITPSYRAYARLFKKHVAYIVQETLQELPEKVRPCLLTLSIFRKFNADTLDALIAKKEITGFNDGGELLPLIANTRLISIPTETDPMFSDRIVRRILNAQLKFTEPKRFHRLHKFAENLYNHWIQSTDINSNPLPIPITDQFQRIFIVESLYHSLQSPDKKNELNSTEIILKKFKANLRELRSVFPDNLPILGVQINDALLHDEELMNDTKFLVGEGAFEDILKIIKRFIDNKGVVDEPEIN